MVARYDTDVILSPPESILIPDMESRQKAAVGELLAQVVKFLEALDALDRLHCCSFDWRVFR